MSILNTTFVADVYDKQIDVIRDTTKWLIGAFAAVGATILGTLKFTDIGQLTGEELALATAIALGAVSAVSVAIFCCARVLSAVRPSLDKVMRDQHLCQEIEEGPVLLLSEYRDSEKSRSVKFLKECYYKHADAVRELEDVAVTAWKRTEHLTQSASRESSLGASLNNARAALEACRLAEHELLTFVNFREVMKRFVLAQRILGICVVVILLLCVWFSVIVDVHTG